jgi:hypothetical protein
MYNDYSLNERFFHWQSQSTTSDTSPTGQRYINHDSQGSKVLLFVRQSKTNALTSSAEAYTFLGTAHYSSHHGSRPMNVIWRLDTPIPARFIRITGALAIS